MSHVTVGPSTKGSSNRSLWSRITQRESRTARSTVFSKCVSHVSRQGQPVSVSLLSDQRGTQLQSAARGAWHCRSGVRWCCGSMDHGCRATRSRCIPKAGSAVPPLPFSCLQLSRPGAFDVTACTTFLIAPPGHALGLIASPSDARAFSSSLACSSHALGNVR